MLNCLDNETLEQLAGRRLAPADAEGVRLHLDRCPACARRWREAQSEAVLTAELRSMLGNRPSTPPADSDDGGAGETDAGVPFQLAGYRIIRRIRRGGQGTVYEAYQESTHRHVAIKVLSHSSGSAAASRRRFGREVELAAELRHPSIVTVFDSGACAGGLYIVMAYIEGLQLDRYLAAHALTARQKVELFVTIVDALTHAHQRGVIHRDLKPSNILVDAQGCPHVLDFGLAKRWTPGDAPGETTEISLDGQVLGTLAYMSPEHVVGRPADIEVRSDVYVLGVLLFQMLTGCFPYDVEGSFTHVFRAVALTPPARPSALVGELDADIETIVLKCLEKDPQRRYQTADALAADLRRYLAGEPLEARRDSSWYVLRKTLGRYRVAVAASAAFLVVISTALVAMIHLRNQAQAAQREAEWQSYLGNLAAANSAVRLHDSALARTRLAAIPPRQRDWCWQYLDSRTDDSLMVLAATPREMQTLALSPDGARIAMPDADGAITIQSLADSRIVARLPAREAPCRALAMHPSGRYLAAGDSAGVVEVFDLTTATAVVADESNNGVFRLAWSAGGDLLAIGSEAGRVAVRSWPSLEVVLENEASNAWGIVGLVFLKHDERLAAAGNDHVLRVWDLSSGALLRALPIHDDDPSDMASDAGRTRLVTTARNHSIRLWDAETFTLLAEHTELDATPNGVALSPDGTTVAIGLASGQLRFWLPDQQRLLPPLHGHGGDIRSIAFSPGGRLVATGSVDGTVRIWAAPDGSDSAVLRGHADMVNAIAFSPDGHLAATASKDCTVALWETRTVRQIGIIQNEFRLNEAAFSADGLSLATGDEEGSVAVWDVATLSQRRRYCTDGWACSALAFDERDGSLVAASLSGGVYVLSANGEARESFRLEQQAPFAVARGGTVVLAAMDGTLWLHDVSSGGGRRLCAHDRPTGMAFSPDGAHLAAASFDGLIRLWSIADGRLERTFAGHVGATIAVAFNAAGTRLISAGHDGLIRLWDVATGAHLLSFAGHQAQVRDVVFLPGSDDFASCSADLTARLWRPRQRMARADVLAHGASAPQTDFFADLLVDRQRAFAQENEAWNHLKTPAHSQAEFEAALAQSTEAVALVSNWVTLKTRAAALYRTGRYEEALLAFRACHGLRGGCTPHYVSDLPLYAMAAWQTGHPDEARQVLAEAQLADARHWQRGDEVIADLLAEAEALIQPAPADH